jgi:hypothetical protein
MIQNMRCEARSTERNPSLKPSVSSETRRENVLFSLVLNQNTLDSGNVVNSLKNLTIK